jgi:outer membrane protein assembly factor BamA
MKFSTRRVVAALLLSLLFGTPTVNAESDMAGDVSASFEPAAFEWAYGQVIDSVSVKGDVKTKSFALLREMESRVGTRLDAVKLARDHRYITDLSSVATVKIEVYTIREGHCGIVLDVNERPLVFLKLIYPVLDYDFNNERFRFGLRINDRNFRRRLQSFTLGYTRNSIGDDNAYIGWSTRWIGWRHIGAAVDANFFRRGVLPPRLSIVEQTRVTTALSLPLTESRISFSQVIGTLSFADNRLGVAEEPLEDEVLISPSLGYAIDRRDSPLRPNRGEFFWVDVGANRVVNGPGSTYYQLRNDVRLFRPLGRHIVLAGRSNLAYQFGDYPEYIRFGMGGAGTLRGQAAGRFEGNHRWIQSFETRITPFSTWIFSVPYAKVVDVTVSTVLFVDAGIVWDNDATFHYNQWEFGYGAGLRIFSPFQDVVEISLGFSPDGDTHFYFRTGVNF